MTVKTGVLVSVLAIVVLTGCGPATDPEVTRESIAEVTVADEPSVVDAINEEFSAELHPEPTVDPLPCSRYLVVTARGTGEPTKGQLLSPVVRTIEQARPGNVETVDLDYPADTEVRAGGTQGVRALIDTLNIQAQECPAQDTVLLGYSQGAMVIGDALTASEDRMVGATAGVITPEAVEHIRAVVLYGNPRFNAGEPYSVGSFSAETDGLLPRPDGALSAIEQQVRDYCVAFDMVCQSSFHASEEAHLEYFSNGMQADGAAFVITHLDPPESPSGATQAQ